VDPHPPLVDGEDLAPHPDEVEDLEMEREDDDDLREDAIGFFGIDVGDDPVGNGNQQPIDLDGDDAGVSASTDTRGTSATASGKRVSAVWEWFDEIKDGKLRTSAICKHCGTRYSARSTGGTGHLIRHMKSCMKKQSSYPAPTREDPNKVQYLLVHQRCACHILNLIV
jgi:hypothetical protein